jgi:PAS domain S-box-containing protein
MLIRDITPHKQAEVALQQAKDFAEQVIETANVIFLQLDTVGNIQKFNSAAEEITGYSFAEVRGKNWAEISVPRERYPYVWVEFNRLMAGGVPESFENPILTRQGEARQILWKNNILREGVEIVGIISFGMDITERKRAEEAVHESEEQYRALFEDSPISLWVEDFSDVKRRLDQLKEAGVEDLSAYLREHSGFVIECANHVRILDVNSAAAKLYHARDKSELMGSLTKVLPTIPVEQFEQELISLASGQLNFEREGVDQTLTGEKIYVSVRWTVAPGYEDTLARVIVSTIDLTERKQAEEMTLLQVQRLRALHAIDAAISSSSDLSLTLNILLDQVITQLNVDAAAVMLFQPISRTLVYAASRGFRSTAIREAKVRLGEGFAGKAILERRTIHVSNLMEAEGKLARAPLLIEEGFVEYYCVPLIAKGQVKGVFEVFHRGPLAPNSEWLDFLATLAGQTAIAVEDATLFESLQRSNQELFQAYDATIEGWSYALDLRDKETEGHTQRVTTLTVELASKFDFKEEQLIHVRWGALLHDIGKMGVPDNILLKPGKLTDEEWEIMRRHPAFALEMLAPIAYLKSSLDIPYCHHEKWDGTGYPRGLKGEVIPLAARIFAVVDVWDALTSDRPYRKAWSTEEATQYIKDQSGAHFDPQVVNVFLNMIAWR